MNANRVTFLQTAVLTNLFVELLPRKVWRQLAAEKKAPRMFYSVKGDLIAGDQVVHAELELNALDSKGALQAIGIERPSLRDGKVLHVLPTDAKSHAIVLAVETVTGADGQPEIRTKVDAKGVPVPIEAVALPADAVNDQGDVVPWSIAHCCKYRVSIDGAKALQLTDVQLSYADAFTSSGHPCASVVPKGVAVVDAPARIGASGGPANFFALIGASGGYQAAARRTAVAAAATMESSPA
jgi:hypothetical protein